MAELLRWALPGLTLLTPLYQLLAAWGTAPQWPAWAGAVLPVGFGLQQIVRAWFEGTDGGFRSPRRAALAAIIERAGLGTRADAGDRAYEVYEVALYGRADWQGVRDHLHRARDIGFLCDSVALGAVLGALPALLLLRRFPLRSFLLLAVLLPTAAVLRHKSRQTLEALELFDRAWVVAHWPAYEAVLATLSRSDRS